MSEIKEIVLAEYRKGNIVIATVAGLQVMPLKDVVKQPVDGLLYDLNRNEEVVLTFITDPKWVNDYATIQVIRELKRQLEASPEAEEIDYTPLEILEMHFGSEFYRIEEENYTPHILSAMEEYASIKVREALAKQTPPEPC